MSDKTPDNENIIQPEIEVKASNKKHEEKNYLVCICKWWP